MARSVECRCEPNRFTCGYCLQNPTLSEFEYQPGVAKRERAERYRQFCLGKITEEEFEVR